MVNPSSSEPKNRVKRVPLLSPEELHCPPTAWPTVILFILSATIFLAPLIRYFDHPTIHTIPCSTLAIYMLFTPFHDAIHRSVSTEHRWLNELIGHLSGIVFLAPLPAYRHIHLSHHKFTNDPVKDPDMWSSHAGHDRWYLLPFFWVTQVLYSYYWYLSRVPSRPRREAQEGIGIAILMILSIIYVCWAGYIRQFLYLFWIPHLIAVCFLAFSFDYAPHRPHDVTREQDIYKSTSMIGGLFEANDGVDLTWPLLYQNFHIIHHLYPMIPFYNYQKIWLTHRQDLTTLGVPIVSYLAPWLSVSVTSSSKQQQQNIRNKTE